MSDTWSELEPGCWQRVPAYDCHLDVTLIGRDSDAPAWVWDMTAPPAIMERFWANRSGTDPDAPTLTRRDAMQAADAAWRECGEEA